MFNKDRFIQDCIKAVAEGQEAVREVVAEAISDGARVMSELGEPEHAGLSPIGEGQKQALRQKEQNLLELAV